MLEVDEDVQDLKREIDILRHDLGSLASASARRPMRARAASFGHAGPPCCDRALCSECQSPYIVGYRGCFRKDKKIWVRCSPCPPTRGARAPAPVRLHQHCVADEATPRAADCDGVLRRRQRVRPDGNVRAHALGGSGRTQSAGGAAGTR